MTQAWCDDKELRVVESEGRIATADGETVLLWSCFPDGTKFVIATKTFPAGTLEAARRRWKTENYANHYGAWDNFHTQWQGADITAEQERQSKNFQAAMDQYFADIVMGKKPRR